MNTFISYFRKWLNIEYNLPSDEKNQKNGVDWFGSIPFVLFHLICFGIIWVGWSPCAVIAAVFLYLVRMFAITAFYHRYFSHRAFTTNRFFAFIFALLACSTMQNGPLWWAAVHRHHHLYADTEKDIHSPLQRGFWWSHIGWVLAYENRRTRIEYLKDWLKYPELVFIDKASLAIPVIAAVVTFFAGHILYLYVPELGTTGLQLLVWGFFISTVASWHATFSINSIDHMFGSRRYEMTNTSRNNAVMAILTLGEGWHNNHHHYAVSAKAGFYWWEIDVTYYLLVILSWLGIVRDLRPLPDGIRERGRIHQG